MHPYHIDDDNSYNTIAWIGQDYNLVVDLEHNLGVDLEHNLGVDLEHNLGVD
jgi:hypothetical protein